MKSSPALGEYLRFLRGNYSQSALADLLGVHRTYISKAESGEFTPPEEIMHKWFEIGHETFKRLKQEAAMYQAMMAVVSQNQDVRV